LPFPTSVVNCCRLRLLIKSDATRDVANTLFFIRRNIHEKIKQKQFVRYPYGFRR